MFYYENKLAIIYRAMAQRTQKPIMYIVINGESQSGKLVSSHVAKYMADISQNYKVEILKSNPKNIRIIRELGVTALPTMVVNGKKIEGAEKIVKILTPVRDQQSGFGMGYDNPEESVRNMMISNMGRPEDDDDEADNREEVIRKKMADFQKKRPQMSDNVPKDARINGGRQIISRQAPVFADDDDSFVRASGRDNITETPTIQNMDDGDSILEEFYLDEAIQHGKKAKTPRINGTAM
jgi:hypothetical protein